MHMALLGLVAYHRVVSQRVTRRARRVPGTASVSIRCVTLEMGAIFVVLHRQRVHSMCHTRGGCNFVMREISVRASFAKESLLVRD